MHPLAQLDHAYLWHPFTQMRGWLNREPIVIVSGKGAILRDVRGREYLDGNSSIWTNLHGHNHPKVNAAIRRQLTKIAHSSALGLANEPASLLGAELVRVANPESVFPAMRKGGKGSKNSIPSAPLPPFPLSKVFFSDDGDFCRSRARITATRLVRLASVTSNCFTGLARGCFSNRTR